MKIYRSISEYIYAPNAIVTIGTFDGVHLGHQAILKKMVADAKAIEGETVVVTFYPHPRQVLNIDSSKLRFITTQEEKIARLENLGIDNLIIIEFTKDFSLISSETFIKNYLIDRIKPVKFVVGYDHHFGNNRNGDFDTLSNFGQKYNFKVERIPVQDIENVAVSSTKIRCLLQSGDVAQANKLLGYQYSYTGKVVHGAEIGRKIGYRTANMDIKPEFQLIEKNGVYATFVDFEGKRYKSMTYIGDRPTINDDRPKSVEVYLFDFEENLYDKTIKVSFIDFVRDEMKFDSMEELKKQIEKDKMIVTEKFIN